MVQLAAIVRLCNFLRVEYGELGLHVHSVYPGVVKTDLAPGMPEYMYQALVDTSELPGDTVVWLTAERCKWLQDRFVSSVWDMEELESRKAEVVDKNLLRLKMAARKPQSNGSISSCSLDW